MPLSDDWQGAFARALLNPEEATPSGLLDPYGMPALKRFAIYRNNVVAGLIEALKVSFPVVCRIVGEQFFKAMARVYVLKNPPQSPVLLDYGETFAGFVDGFAPAASLPYLGDVARIERAWLDAYHAPAARSFSPSTWASIPPEEAPAIRLHVHPSLRLIRSKFPSFTIWNTNIEGGTPTAVDLEAGGENVFVCRQAAGVEIHRLSSAGMEFVRSIAAGRSVVEASGVALDVDNNFDLPTTLARMMEAGCFVACRNTRILLANSQRHAMRPVRRLVEATPYSRRS
jgi:Putative DNA-binding domain